MEDKISLEEKPPEQKPQRRKLAPVEARQHYEMVLLVWVVLGWWFVRDAWFNSSESMLEHKGFNTVGAIGCAVGALYAVTMFLSAALTVTKNKIDAAADPEFAKHETKRWWICAALCVAFVALSWTNKDIDRLFNLASAVLVAGLTAFAVMRWRKLEAKGAASPPQP